MRLTMCGIVAAVAKSNIVPILIEGLNKLEYLGYNSARTALQIGKDRPIQEGTLSAAPTHLANPEPLR